MRKNAAYTPDLSIKRSMFFHQFSAWKHLTRGEKLCNAPISADAIIATFCNGGRYAG